VLGIPVERAPVSETTALGAACLAGLAAGFWANDAEMRAALSGSPPSAGNIMRFEPNLERSRSEQLYAGWRRAVERAKGWIEH
ncbi:MAG: glycerol kinase, partial [Terriglobia bacterium]